MHVCICINICRYAHIYAFLPHPNTYADIGITWINNVSETIEYSDEKLSLGWISQSVCVVYVVVLVCLVLRCVVLCYVVYGELLTTSGEVCTGWVPIPLQYCFVHNNTLTYPIAET